MERTSIAPDELIYAQAAVACGVSTAHITRLLQKNGYKGRRVGRRNALVISRADLERMVGRQISDEQLAKAKQYSAPITDKVKRERRDRIERERQLTSYDRGWIAFGAEARDLDWQRHLLALGIKNIKPPPFYQDYQLTLDGQRIFTRQQVELLLASAVQQRNNQWDDWVNDPVHRAQHPNGPPPLQFKYPDTE